ncbi:ABC transporter ATP-binding protein, partial [Streptomyces anulatus]|nr:ABC transporter ATP-binding protein [Streptomyces anulatus]
PGALVVVAHRLSSARRAGRILVMDGPRTQCGTPDELLRSCALYRDLAGLWEPEATGQPEAAGTAGEPEGPGEQDGPGEPEDPGGAVGTGRGQARGIRSTPPPSPA